MKTWQRHLGVWGTIAWFASFNASAWAGDQGWDSGRVAIAGYMIGFATYFSGFIFWELVKGRGAALIDEEPMWQAILAVPLALLFLIGMAGLWNELNGASPLQYNLAALMAAITVGQGLVPLIEDSATNARA